MPFYDYQGKTYDIETDDPDQARAKIQAYLNAQPSEGTPAEQATNTAMGQVATGVAQDLINPNRIGPYESTPAAKAAGTTAKAVGTVASLPVRAVADVANIAKNLYGVTGAGFKEIIEHPYSTAKAYAMGSPTLGPVYNALSGMANQSPRGLVNQAGQYAKDMVGKIPSGMSTVGRGLVAGAIAPENIMLAPYTMAGYEMEKIRQNPTAPEYATNPYGQVVRGEAPTMGAAGAMNRRGAIAGQQYGGLTPSEQRMLEQDRIDQAIRRKAASKVLGPVVPQGY
jgi:hypothetical protein